MSIEDEAKKVLLKLGMWWPDANSGTLRHAAQAWRTFADAVDDVRTPVNNTANSLIHNNKGEAIETFTTFWERYAKGKDAGWLSDLSKSSRKMAEGLEKFADAVDDAITKLWTQIGIDAAVIAGGIALAFVTAGLASGAAVAAADVIIEMGATLGVAVSTTVAEIAAGTLVAAAFGGVESVTVDLAVAQPLKIATGLQSGFSLDEINQAAKDGMIFGGALGAGSGVLKAGVEGAFTNPTPFMLRPPSLRPDLVELGPAARNCERTRCVGEPIDVATGAMLMSQTDLSLPASFPFVFERTHLSSYRGGVCFGPTWISTLDECVQIDSEGVVFAGADGMRLVYPVPTPGEPVLPVKGPRWPLEWDGKPDGVMTVTDPATGVVRSFSTPLNSATPGIFHLPIDAWQDRGGARIDIERNAGGVPEGIRHSGGYYLAVDSHGPRITALRLLEQAPDRYSGRLAPDAGTVVMRYAYDDAGNLSEVINSSGEPLTFAYDDQGRMTRWTDRNGTWFSYVYDERGRVVRTEGVDGILSGTLTYDDTARTTTYTDSLGHTSSHRYNTEGLVVEETNALGHTTRTQWDERGDNPLTSTDPLGRTTRYSYDDHGNLTELTLPDGSVARAAYNRLGQAVEVVEPGGATWHHTYDDHGNLLTTTDPLGARTSHVYNELGHLTSVTDPLGGVRRVTPNAAGIPVAVTDELGHTTTIRRDAFGRPVEVTDPLGHTTRTTWTTEGKPARREHPDGTTESWTWDSEGNPLTHTDQAGHTTHHTAGHFDVPATRTTPDGTTYTFTHDTERRLTGVTNAQGLTWSYTYDETGRPTAETDFNGRTLTYSYNAAGELVSRTNGAGEALHFTRDPLGRITEQRSGADAVSTYTYDAAGHLVRAVNADAELVLARDALGRVTAETVNGRTTTYEYDACERLVGRTTPSGLVSRWSYSPTGRPVELSSDADTLTFAYDAAGRETSRRFGDGVTLHQDWDAGGRLASQSLTSLSSTGRSDQADRLLQHRTYAYRADGFLTEIRDLSSGTRKFLTNPVGRVMEVRAHGWTETYAYDSSGNLTRAAAPATGATSTTEPDGTADAREFEGTLIRRSGNTRYQHDAQGRLVRRTRKLLNGKRQSWTYSWSAEDRLTEAVTPEGERWQYAYDPMGRRIAKYRLLDDGTEAERTGFTWDDTRLAEQTAPDGRVTAWDYAPGTHTPLTQTGHRPLVRTGGVSLLSSLAEDTTADRTVRFHAVITDTAGTPTELVGVDGELAWQHHHVLWGARRATTPAGGSADCPLRFPGQYADPETGLHYNYFRYYDPETARYLSADPLGLDPAPNHHGYVDTPLSMIDPLGLKTCDEPVPTQKPRTGVKGLIKEAQLPTSGRIRFVPSQDVNVNSGLPRGTRKGYIDRFGNEWIKGPSRTAGQPFEWDVQLSKKGKAQLGWLSRDGSHLNVSLDGEITHK
ncbi:MULTISPECIES: polymorphic toxin type 17 domain-containing protein [unclassified Streptomyces]|uniref:polymorphic toxin type 17 domain-containing protein n=1 Tax=unclassified Streptomyces TaxID=2593676 RepID=UPI0034019486